MKTLKDYRDDIKYNNRLREIEIGNFTTYLAMISRALRKNKNSSYRIYLSDYLGSNSVNFPKANSCQIQEQINALTDKIEEEYNYDFDTQQAKV